MNCLPVRVPYTLELVESHTQKWKLRAKAQDLNKLPKAKGAWMLVILGAKRREETETEALSTGVLHSGPQGGESPHG